MVKLHSKKQKKIADVKARGYKAATEQHNGMLLGKIHNGWLYKKVVRDDGQVMTYKPTKPNKYEKELY